MQRNLMSLNKCMISFKNLKFLAGIMFVALPFLGTFCERVYKEQNRQSGDASRIPFLAQTRVTPVRRGLFTCTDST